MLFLLFFVAYHDVTAACMFVPVWGHLTNTMNVDIVQSFFFFSLQRSLIIFPLRCRVIGYLKKTTGLQWLSFWVHRQSTRRLLICWYWTVLIIMNLITVWNKTSLDYLNNLGREEESNCWYWSVGVCLKKKKKKGFGELSCQRNLGLKTCNFSVNTVFCIECLLFC